MSRGEEGGRRGRKVGRKEMKGGRGGRKILFFGLLIFALHSLLSSCSYGLDVVTGAQRAARAGGKVGPRPTDEMNGRIFQSVMDFLDIHLHKYPAPRPQELRSARDTAMQISALKATREQPRKPLYFVDPLFDDVPEHGIPTPAA